MFSGRCALAPRCPQHSTSLGSRKEPGAIDGPLVDDDEEVAGALSGMVTDVPEAWFKVGEAACSTLIAQVLMLMSMRVNRAFIAVLKSNES